MYPDFKFFVLSLILFCLLGCKEEGFSPNSVVPKTEASHNGKNVGFTCFPNRMPEFPGGSKSLMRYLSTHVSYPSQTKMDRDEKTVVVCFLIEKDGSLHHVHAVGRTVDQALKKEAVQVVKNMPPWEPAIRISTHKPVPTAYSLPIRFKKER